MQQQITRGDYLEDLITIYIDNNLQQSLTDLYSMFVFQCGEIQKQLTPASVIKISFTEQESQLLTDYNTCYLAGITADGHKETFNGSISFNTRGEVVYYEPTPNGSLIASTTSVADCPCRGISGVFANCTQPSIKAYFSINYVPTKLSELQNDTDFQDSVDVAESISIHNTSTEAHPYIQGLISNEASVRASETEALGIRIDDEVSVRASQTEALSISIGAETTAREQAISLAISTTEGYADTLVQSATTAINTTIGDLSSLDTSVKSSVTNAINAEVATRISADNNLQNQIDGLAAASDVTDIVGTYAELQSYDTQHLNDNDIIKVLSDSTHDDEPSYYRYDKDTDTFSYIGSESAAYTKAQSDSIFVTQTTEINGHALSSDINLTASDVGALANTTTINDLTSTAQQNALNSGVTTTVVSQVGTNATNITTINGKIPTDASSSNKLVSASTLAASIADFANKDLNNLSTTGTQKLRSLTAYSNEGELLTDAEGLADVTNYAHSTFDISKFNVIANGSEVSNPTVPFSQNGLVITTDGIASGFSSSNYLTTPDNIFSSSTSDFDILLKIKTGSRIDNVQDILCSSASPIDGFLLQYGNRNLLFYRSVNGVWSEVFRSDNINVNTEYFIRILQENGTIKLYYGTDINNLPLVGTPSANVVSFSDTRSCLFGNRGGGSFPFLGSFDLKGVNISVDGVPVFSGNKTGVDTIKTSNFTVATTSMKAFVYDTHTIYADSDSAPTELYNADGTIHPQNSSEWQIVGTDVKYNGNTATYTSGSNITSVENPPLPFDAGLKITEDGIASGFSSGNYLKTPTINLSTAKSWEIVSPWFSVSTFTSALQSIINADYSASSGGVVYIAVKSSSKIETRVAYTTWGGGYYSPSDISIVANKKYQVRIEFTGTKYNCYYRSEDNLDWTQTTDGGLTSSTKVSINNVIGIGATQAGMTPLTNGFLNLNAFKIYVDGNLVYQPCLKIPYTESKTGSKIVNSVYRDRVNDMAEQFGYAPYYTLDEDNSNFTLPQVELYGLIEKLSKSPDYTTAVTISDIYTVDKVYTFGYKSQAIIKPSTPASTYTISYKKAGATNYSTINAYGYMTLEFETGDMIYTSVAAGMDIYKEV